MKLKSDVWDDITLKSTLRGLRNAIKKGANIRIESFPNQTVMHMVYRNNKVILEVMDGNRLGGAFFDSYFVFFDRRLFK